MPYGGYGSYNFCRSLSIVAYSRYNASLGGVPTLVVRARSVPKRGCKRVSRGIAMFIRGYSTYNTLGFATSGSSPMGIYRGYRGAEITSVSPRRCIRGMRNMRASSSVLSSNRMSASNNIARARANSKATGILFSSSSSSSSRSSMR